MKAVVVRSAYKIEIKDFSDPIISDYEVLCETLATAVCSGTDNHIVAGHPYFVKAFPLILGHEGIGRVVKVGKKAQNLKIGNIVSRVFNKLPKNSKYVLREGAFATKTIAVDWRAMKKDGMVKEKWKKFMVHRVLPKDIDPIKATMIITWRETLSFLYRIKPQKNDKVLIIGSGANALAFVEHLRSYKTKTSVIGSLKRKSVFQKAGAQNYYSYKNNNFLKDKYFNDFDIVIDAIGDNNLINNILLKLKDGAKIALYGLNKFNSYSLLATANRGDFCFFNGENYNEESAHNEVMRNIKNKKLNWDLYINNKYIYKIKDIEKALQVSKRGEAFKSVISFL